MLRSLKQFDAKYKLQQLALSMMVDSLSEEEHVALAMTFTNMDTNGDNLITITEFREAFLQTKDINLTPEKVDKMFACAVCGNMLHCCIILLIVCALCCGSLGS